MNKFVELSLELNFHANWHLSLLVKFAFDSIYLCTLMSAFWISSGMLRISIACSRTIPDPFRELGWIVEFWVAGVGEVSMFFSTPGGSDNYADDQKHINKQQCKPFLWFPQFETWRRLLLVDGAHVSDSTRLAAVKACYVKLLVIVES